MVGAGSICLGYSGQSLFLPNWFIRRRGLAIGLAFAGVGIGSVTLLPWVQLMIEQTGWRTACTAMGSGAGGAGADQPVVAQAPGGYRAAAGRRRRAFGIIAKPLSNIVDPVWAGTDWTLRRALRTARFWWISLGYFCGLYIWYAVQVHQTKYLLDIGFSADCRGLGAGRGQPARHSRPDLARPSVRPDRPRMDMGRRAALGFAICFAALIALKSFPTLPLVYLMVVTQGALGYGLTSIMGAVVLEIFQGRHYGSIFGTVMLAALAGGAAGPWVTGLLHDLTGSYTIAFAIGIAVCVSRRSRSGWRPREKSARLRGNCTGSRQALLQRRALQVRWLTLAPTSSREMEQSLSCPGRGAAFFTLLRRAGTHALERVPWTPAQQRTARRCAASGERNPHDLRWRLFERF